jgi:hypothetical protein
MSVNGDAELKASKREELRHGLITSSTKRRITELSGLEHRIADNSECAAYVCSYAGRHSWRVT